MFRFFGVSTALFLTLAVSVIAARAAGSASKPPALSFFESHMCSPKPCWHSIRLGATTISKVMGILRSDPASHINHVFPTQSRFVCWDMQSQSPWVGCVFSKNSRTIDSLALTTSERKLRLGDMFQLFGEPTRARLCGGSTYMYFRAATVVARNNWPQLQLRFNPDVSVTDVFFEIGETPPSVLNAPRWRGFVTLQAESLGCE
jgi:hypothetical protein